MKKPKQKKIRKNKIGQHPIGTVINSKNGEKSRRTISRKWSWNSKRNISWNWERGGDKKSSIGSWR